MLSFYLSMVKTEDERDKVTFIYESFYSLMKHVALKYVKKLEDAEDIVQESMISIIERIDTISISDRNKIKNLCAVVARSRAIDFCRAKDNHVLPMEEDVALSTDSLAPIDVILEKEVRTIILREINSLSDIYRDVCILKYVNRLKERDIAHLLGISPKTVSTRILRARHMLREALRKELLRG